MTISVEQITKIIGELEGNKLYHISERENLRGINDEFAKQSFMLSQGNIMVYDTAIKLLKKALNLP